MDDFPATFDYLFGSTMAPKARPKVLYMMFIVGMWTAEYPAFDLFRSKSMNMYGFDHVYEMFA